MVKARFPGKPSKHFQRRKVSAVCREDNESIKAAEDVYKRLEVFNMLFSTKDENNTFHGFSPHQNDKDSGEVNVRLHLNSKIKKRKLVRHSNVKKEKQATEDTSKEFISDDNKCLDSTSSMPIDSSLISKCGSEVKDMLLEKKEDLTYTSALPGIFTLPTRSVHSSRVIKPNKRFLHSDTSLIPIKRPRLISKSEMSDQLECASDISPESGSADSRVNEVYCKTDKESEISNSSPVKFILRKPRLKIKSQPLSLVEGPFSSSGEEAFRGLKYSYSRVMKVCCGVCGYICTYKFFRQARKFGIFSCESCRQFILKIIRLEREKQLTPLVCSSGTGNCSIRQSTLMTQPFSDEPTPKIGKMNLKRCEGCWLNLCLRSFHMPENLCRRLSSYLPSQINLKPIMNINSSRNDTNTSVDKSKSLPYPKVADINIETRVVRRGRGIRENLILRRGSNTSLCLSSHRSKAGREEGGKKQKGRQRVAISGPRVKHVCRSASLVLGQPTATFLQATNRTGGNVNHEIKEEMGDISENMDHAEVESVTSQGSENKNSEVTEGECQDKNELELRPVARMLQDLGRANCELLDGLENHELEQQNARVSIDFWENYDPEEVTQMGFPLIGFSPLTVRAVCFLCGSAGLEKMIHCASCCEPYHTFCVSSVRSSTSFKTDEDWWRVDWLCPKCIQCEACQRTGGSQISCSKCFKSYHSSCISNTRSDNNWVCPSCLFCKSCNGAAVHVFVGNIPLCKICFRLRKKGSFCPLCQRCYDDNDYNTNMMECAECKCWIHAQCEGISNEKYQVLSYLPSHIEFVCKLCCKSPPAPWSLAVNAELKAGYLNVIKFLSKNKNACTLLKASPKKHRVCVCLDKHRNPIHLPDLGGNSDSDSGNDSSSRTSPDRDYKCPDLGLLTPKLTKDDEESLKTVKRDFLNLVSDKDNTSTLNPSDNIKGKTVKFLSPKEDCTQLLKIAYHNVDVSSRKSSVDFPAMDSHIDSVTPQRKVCTCQNMDNTASPLNLMLIKNKASMNEYKSVSDFHKDMEQVILDIEKGGLMETYHKSLRQVFPWFDPNDSRVCDSSISELDLENKLPSNSYPNEKKTHKEVNDFNALMGLLNLDQEYYYIGLKVPDLRYCMLCKEMGEGLPIREGRLLYCGQNEWVHTNCALWSSEVFEEIDGSLQNVHSAISRARLIRCYECGKKGASLGCCARSCPAAYHFSCARVAECVFLENKEIFCKTHSNMRTVKEISKDEDFLITRSVYVELDPKKKKDVKRNEVRVFIGSFAINQIGEILPELSDGTDIITPSSYSCSRLYWSCKEPWKIVKYFIQTKVINLTKECSFENDTNYTVDHSLEFTPPPSPVESINRPVLNEKDIKSVLSYLVDTICSKEEEGTLSDQQNTDLFPPEIQDAIFKDLPQDFLDRVSVHDIFTKMNFDNMLVSETRNEKTDSSVEIFSGAPVESVCQVLKYSDCDYQKSLKNKTQIKNPKSNSIYKVVSLVKQKGLERHETYLDSGKSKHWERQSLLQVDGALDLSESDHSNDSCDVTVRLNEQERDAEGCSEDTPVKCPRCHRTYRTSNSYDKHLSICNSNYLSCSESDMSEEEKTQGVPENNSSIKTDVKQLIETENFVESTQVLDNSSGFSITLENKQILPVGVNILPQTENIKLEPTLVPESFNNSVICVNNSSFGEFCNNSSERVLNISYPSSDGTLQSTFNNEQTLVSSVDSLTDHSHMVNIQPPPSAIILQQVPGDRVLSTYVPQFQEPPHPNLQYITAINTQEKFLTTSVAPQIHIQTPSIVQNIPTVLGTVIQSNGIEQLVLNSPGTLSNLDLYGQLPNNLFISNPPMLVGLETVVSNTVMSSSRLISGTAPGLLSASSFSATTTQVFQAAKPVLDIPQGYVVVDTSPSIIENGNCLQNIVQNGSIAQPSWTNYKINYQDSVKLNKNFTYQALTQQIMSQKQEINGVKLVGPREQSFQIISGNMPSKRVKRNVTHISENCKSSKKTVSACTSGQPRLDPQNFSSVLCVKPNQVKIALSSPQLHKEKLHQFVAPVTSNKFPESSTVKTKIEDFIKVEASNTQSIEEKEVTEKEKPMLIKDELLSAKETIKSVSKVSSDENEKYINKIQMNKSANDDHSLSNVSLPFPKSNKPKTNGYESIKKRKIIHEEPKITYEITSEDGFSFSTTDINEAWLKVFETVQKARKGKNLPPLSQNPFSSPDSMLKKLMGLGNNSVKYLLEQLPGISGCSKYKPIYHKKPLSLLEQELSRGDNVNPSGCARTESFKYIRKTYDMFSWLASRHRRPPKLLPPDNDVLNGNSRRATSMNLPMAMRFRHLKETSKVSVGVFRSDIHGRGLFCLRDIDSGEMVIEYAGEVIRSALTDKRERHYTEKGIGCYMFRIDDKFVVDATMKGNAARFINHSCEPNCYSRVIDILGKKHILIFALRRILQGEELTYDYKFPLEEDKINCHCLSRKCRKYLN